MENKGLRRGESVSDYIERVGQEAAKKTPFILGLSNYSDGGRCNWKLLKLIDRTSVAKNVDIKNLASIVKNGLYKNTMKTDKPPVWLRCLMDKEIDNGFVYCHLESKRIGSNGAKFRGDYGNTIIRLKDYVKGVSITDNTPLNYPRLFWNLQYNDETGWSRCTGVSVKEVTNEFDFLYNFADEVHVYSDITVKDFESVQIHGLDIEALEDETMEVLQKNGVDIFHVDNETINKLNARGVWEYYSDI